MVLTPSEKLDSWSVLYLYYNHSCGFLVSCIGIILISFGALLPQKDNATFGILSNVAIRRFRLNEDSNVERITQIMQRREL